MVKLRSGESFPKRDAPTAARRRIVAGSVRKEKKKGSSGPAAPQPPPPRVRPERAALGIPTVADTDALDCGVCFLPLKPPIFQCNSGHVVCSACRDKLKAIGKCHVCGTATGGYLRCHAMENLVQSVRVPCPHAIHGCTARPAYYDLDMHRQTCPDAGYHCPGKVCGFIGPVDGLLDHLAGVHGWPCAKKTWAGKYQPCFLRLRYGFNFLLADGTANRRYLFLLNVVRQPRGRAISVARIVPPRAAMDQRGASSLEDMKFALTYSRRSSHPDEAGELVSYNQSSTFRVARADPANGLPSPEGGRFQFELLDSVLGDDEVDAIQVGVRIVPCSS